MTPNTRRRRRGPDTAREEALRARGFRAIAGVDEVGRGPLAGPVVAAAVVLPAGWEPRGVDDSKRLKPEQRQALDAYIRQSAVCWALGRAAPPEIARLNIHHASLLAMRRAVNRLRPAADYLLVDGRFAVPMEMEQEAVVGGDGLVASVAAASVLAKVARDALMRRMHQRWPVYNFAANKGYGTAEHRAALDRHGPSPVHRLGWSSVSQLSLEWGDA